MKIYYKAVFLILLIFFTSSLQATPITLDQLLATAYNNKPSLQSALQDITANKAAERQVYTSYLPNINVSAEISSDTNETRAADGPVSTVLTIDARKTFFDMSKVGENNAARFATASAQAQKNDVQNKIQNQVETTFLKAWLLQKKEELMQFKAQVAQLLFAQAEAKFKLNLSNSNEYQAAKTTQEQELTLVAQYNNEYKTAHALLEQAVGTKLKEQELFWNVNQQLSLYPLEYYLLKAKEYRQDLKRQSYEMSKADAILKKTWWQQLPKTSLFTTLIKTSETNVGEGYFRGTVLNAGIKFNWSIFDAANNLFERDKLEALKIKSILDGQDLALNIKADVTTAYNEYCNALQQLAPQLKTIEQARLDFKLKELQAQVGSLSPIELKSAAIAFKTIEFDWMNATITAALKERMLLFACGYPK